MGFIRFSLLFCFFISFISPVIANECSSEDQDYADFWQNYYAPTDAYAFGVKIQNLVSNKDLSGIFSLVQGELQNGPRKQSVTNKTFKEVFNEEWIEQVLADNAPCSPVGWRGFMLGRGSIWYNKIDSGWTILSINGAAPETDDNPLLGWNINKRIIHPFCFNRPWMSGDNFEEFADVFGIKKLGQFFKDPGHFMGSSISNFAPIRPSWCQNDGVCEKISLAAQIGQCSPEKFDFEDRDGDVWIKHSSDGYDIEYSYRILGPISNKRCSDLAPNIGVSCNKGYLISVGDYSGGSMGWDISYGVYGFFDLPNFGPSVVPLKFFSNKNEGLNFLDEN